MRRRTLAKLVALAAVAGLGGLLFAWSGLFNIGASTGHWAITSWFLHFAMRNSVETHSMGIAPPMPLDDAALVIKGAGHFARGCAPCHSTPGEPRNPVVLEMTPHPPELAPRISRWDPGELFWIVRHGVKFTGMPAWPAPRREDEVWAVVAFLLQLPQMSPAEYRRAAYGDGGFPVEADGRGDRALATSGLKVDDPLLPVLANCARCHGFDGRSRGEGAFPILAGQKVTYLEAALESYAAGRRFSGIMQVPASGLSAEQIAALARHYGAGDGGTAQHLTGHGSGASDAQTPADEAALRLGERIALEGIAREGIPPCVSCHGPAETPRHPVYPILAGQHRGYLAQQLALFKEDARGGTPFADIMALVAGRLTPEQIVAVSEYYATLDPADPP